MLRDLHPFAWVDLRPLRSLITLVCAVAIAMASMVHVVADVGAAHGGTLTIRMAGTDADRSAADGMAEACHSCAVVSFLVASQGAERERVVGLVPRGRSLHLFSFRQPATAPPPKA